MDRNTTAETMTAAFERWQCMNAEVSALSGRASEQQCEWISRHEERMLALPVATLSDLWQLVAAVMDPPAADDFTHEARLARRARTVTGLPPNRS